MSPLLTDNGCLHFRFRYWFPSLISIQLSYAILIELSKIVHLQCQVSSQNFILQENVVHKIFEIVISRYNKMKVAEIYRWWQLHFRIVFQWDMYLNLVMNFFFLNALYTNSDALTCNKDNLNSPSQTYISFYV